MKAPNSQLLPLPCSPKSRGAYTGERLARDRPEVYAEIIELLASGARLNWIADRCQVSRHTIRAVREREADSIAQFQVRLAFKCSWVAETALHQLAEALAKRQISPPLLIKIVALSTDMFLKLSRDMAPPVYDIPYRRQPVTAFQSGPADAHGNLLPKPESVSDLGAETHLLAEKRVRQKRTEFFTVVFYGLRIFCCKMAQFCVTPRKLDSLGSPLKNMLRNAVKICATR